MKSCFLKNIAFAISMFFLNVQGCEDDITYFDPSQRPDKVQSAVNAVFARLGQNRWNYNGSPEYGLGGIPDFQVIRNLIISKHTREKEKDNAFVKIKFLDFGAGDFSWSRNVVSCINEAIKNGDLPCDIKVRICSVRGEPSTFKNEKFRKIVSGACEEYYIYNSKIESMQKDIRMSGLSFFPKRGRCDLIVSSWTLRHLVDPVGSFKFLLDSLIPSYGYLLCDGFLADFTDRPIEKHYESNFRLILHNMENISYLINLTDTMHQFIIKRTSNESPKIPLRYNKDVSVRSINNRGYDVFADQITVYEPFETFNPEHPDLKKFVYATKLDSMILKRYYLGTDKDSQVLFDTLISEGIILKPSDD